MKPRPKPDAAIYLPLDRDTHKQLKDRAELRGLSARQFCLDAIRHRLSGDESEVIRNAIQQEVGQAEQRIRKAIAEEITVALNTIRRETSIEVANVSANAFTRIEERIEKQEQAFLLIAKRLVGGV